MARDTTQSDPLSFPPPSHRYVEALEKIIHRDFFPDLPRLRGSRRIRASDKFIGQRHEGSFGVLNRIELVISHAYRANIKKKKNFSIFNFTINCKLKLGNTQS